MLADFVREIVSLASKAQAVEKIELPRGKLLLCIPGSEPREVEQDPIGPDDCVSSLSSFVDWVNDRKLDREVDVMVGRDKVTAFIDRAQPHLFCACRLPLIHSTAWDSLMDWASSPRTQRGVVRALRTELADRASPNYLEIFKRLDFSRSGSTSNKVGHAGESMGRSIERAAQSSAGEIPETLGFSVPVWTCIPECVSLSFALTVDHDASTIEIDPIGDCVEAALASMQNELRLQLQDALGDGVRVYEV